MAISQEEGVFVEEIEFSQRDRELFRYFRKRRGMVKMLYTYLRKQEKAESGVSYSHISGKDAWGCYIHISGKGIWGALYMSQETRGRGYIRISGKAP